MEGGGEGEKWRKEDRWEITVIPIRGQHHLLLAFERCEQPKWLRVAEKILEQTREEPMWNRKETLAYSLEQIKQGRDQFRLLLSAILDRIRSEDQRPAALSDNGSECPICFERLCMSGPTAFVGTGSACAHFLCARCARTCVAGAQSSAAPLRCPECRREAAKVAPMPPLLEDPLAWFDFLASADGTVTKTTLVRAVAAMLPVDAEELASAIDGGLVELKGTQVTAAEFLADGLYGWVLRCDGEEGRGGERGT